MNQELNFFDKIEKYLDGKMSLNEREDFEMEMATNPDLGREVELHSTVHEQLKDVDSLRFRQKMAQIKREQKRKSKKTSSFMKIAASILVLLGFSIVFWIQSRSNSSSLFEEYYTIYPIEDIVRGTKENNLEFILESYSNEDYFDVIPALENLVKEESENERYKLYLGNCYLNTNQEEKALQLFNSIVKESQYYEDARWYMALLNLKLNRINNTNAILESIVTLNGRHKENAQSLLNALKSI